MPRLDPTADHPASGRAKEGAPPAWSRSAVPRAPRSLSAEGKAIWHRLAPELYRTGRLGLLDTDALAWYCDLAVQVGRALTLHWDGASWTGVGSPDHGQGVDNVLMGVSATASNDVWTVGVVEEAVSPFREFPLVEHWNGTSWALVPATNLKSHSAMNDVSALAPSDAWTVGYFDRDVFNRLPVSEHWNGTKWSPVRPDQASLEGVSAVAPNDVWAVGSVVEHWDGTLWSIVPS